MRREDEPSKADVEAFQRQVKALLDDRKLSSRLVSERARGRISNTSVLNMLRGHLPSADVLVEFAEAVGEGPEEVRQIADQLLGLAGKRLRYAAPREDGPGEDGPGDSSQKTKPEATVRQIASPEASDSRTDDAR